MVLDIDRYRLKEKKLVKLMTELKKDLIQRLVQDFGYEKSELSKKSKTYLMNLLATGTPQIHYQTLQATEENPVEGSAQPVVKYLYHISDLHLKVLDRHAEYAEVFETLFEMLQQEPKGIIVVTGDVFQSRDRLLSETIILFDKLILGLTGIAETVMIPGNHDTYAFSDRMDIIEGMVEVKKYPKLHYLNKSGVYTIGNIEFVVSSPSERSILSDNPVQDLSKKRVCLYHGAVFGCSTENGMIMNDNDLPRVGDFDSFDMTLLGDIHKFQLLSPTVAYAGSLIQQNYKEDLKNHGYIKWNVEDLKGTFVPVPNNYGYLKLNIDKLHDCVIDELPKYMKLKVLLSSESVDTEETITNFKKKVTEAGKEIVSFAKEFAETEVNVIEESPDSEPVRMSDNSLITLLAKDRGLEKLEPELLNLHSEYLGVIGDANEKTESVDSWSLESLEFKNCFIFGGNHINFIDFTEKKGTVGLLAANASGKSSTMNILMYGLFGQIFKTKSYTTRNIIHKHHDNFYIKLVLSNGKGTKYEIHRQGKNKKRKTEISLEDSVTLKRITAKSEEYINDSNKVKTNELILKVLGISDKEEFAMTNLISHGSKTLIGMSNSEIEEVFRRLFDLNHFKTIHQQVGKKIRAIQRDITESNGEIKGLERTTSKTVGNMSKLETDLECIINELKNNESNIEKVTKTILSLELELECLKADTYGINTDVSIQDLKNDIYRLKKELPDCEIPKQSTDQLNDQLDVIESKMKGVSNAPKKNTSRNSSQLESEIKTLQMEVESYSKRIGDYKVTKSGFEKAKEVLVEDSVKLLHESLKGLIVRLKSNEYTDEDLDTLVEFLENTVDGRDSEQFAKMNTANKYIRDYHDFSKLQELLYESKAILKDAMCQLHFALSEKFDSLNDQLVYLEIAEELSETQQKIDSLVQYNDKLRKLTEVKVTIAAVIHQKKGLQDISKEYSASISKLERQIGETQKILKVTEEATGRIEELKQEIDIWTKEIDLLTTYKDFVDDQGLPKIYLRETVKMIEKESNKVFYHLTGLKVFFNSSHDGKYEFLIRKDNMVLSPEQCSGYEKFILNISLKLALDSLKSFSRITALLIDEAWDVVSIENMYKIDDLLLYLKKYYSHILVISHNESLKEKVDNIINIQCDGVVSKIIP